ncbi:MAG: phage tail tape measure protein, partial [Planktothrix sp.]
MVAVGGVEIPVNLGGIQNFNNQLNQIKNGITGLQPTIKGLGLASAKTGYDIYKIQSATKGLSPAFSGANAGILKAGLALGKYSHYAALLLQTISPALISQQATFYAQTISTIFAPITTNALILQQIASKYSYSGLTFYGRYLDYAKVAGIVKEINAIAPKGGILNFGLEGVSSVVKFQRELMATKRAADMTAVAINQIVQNANQISLDTIANAGNLLSGSGFGAIPTGPTVFSMFDTRQAIESRVAFEQMIEPLLNIQKLSGQTKKEISSFENNLLNLSLTSRQSTEDLANSTKAMLMQGQSASESKTNLSDLAKIALGTSVNIEELTTAALDVGQAFKDLSSKDIASALSIVSTKTGTAITQYSNAIKNLNPSIQESGQSLTDLLTILGQLSNAGFEGEEAGNKLNLLFQSLNDLASNNAPKFAQFGLEQLGINPEDLVNSQGQLKSILEISNLIRERVSAFSETNGSAATQGLLTTIFGTREANVVTALLQATTEDINSLNKAISGSTGLTKTLADSKSETFTAQLQKLSDSASIVSTKIGGVVVPIFQALISPIANLVSSFAQLPPAIIAGTIAFNAALPAILLYNNSARTLVRLRKLKIFLTTAWNGLLDLSTGKLTLNTIATKANAEAQKLMALGNTFLAGTYDLLTGKMSLAVAKQNILNASQKFGDANLKEFLSTTKDATAIMLKHALTLGLVVVAFNVFSELMRKSEGAKFAEQLNKSTEEINKFNEQLNATIPNTNSFKDYLLDLGEIASQKGWIEALRTGLGDLEGTLTKSNGTLDTYGKGWGYFITGTQLGNQKAMFALEENLSGLNNQLDIGYNLLTKYGNGTKLTATESEAYKNEIGKQIESLKKYKEALEKTKAPTEEQQALQNANIKLVDKQIAILQGRVKGLNEEGNTIKNIVVPSYDELISKYDELNRKGKLRNTNQEITIEQSLVSGDISSSEAQQKKYLAEQQRINNEITLTNQLKKDLQASITGAVDDERAKIQTELNNQIQKELDLKLELIKNQGNINQFNQQNDIEKARIGILRAQSFEKINQLKLEKEIAQGKIKGNDIEKERAKLQLASLNAQLTANEQAQNSLKGKKGETIGEEQQKLKSEAIEIQTQIAQAQIQENERVAKLKSENEQKLKEQSLKNIEDEFKKEQQLKDKLRSESEIKTARNDFKLNELKAQETLTQSLNELDKQRLNFQLELSNRAQNSTQSEQIKLKIYEQQKKQLELQQQQQKDSISLSKEQQQLDIERKKLSADLAILEAQANLDKANASGASSDEIASLESVVAIRQKQRDLIDTEAESINKINALEGERIDIENKVKGEQLEQQRILELQDITVNRITQSLEYQKSLNDLKSSQLDLSNKGYENQLKLIESQQSLIQSTSNLEKQRIDYQLELANRSGDVAKVEQLKAEIYLQQREEILRQHEAQKQSFILSQKQQEIELQKQHLQAQSALLEAQGNVAKAQALGFSGQQLDILKQQANLAQQQLNAIDKQFVASAQINKNEAKRIGLENQIKLEQIDQQRQLELQDLAVQRITKSFEKQKAELESITSQMDLNNAAFDRQSALMSAQSGLNDSVNNLEKQRLDFRMQLAELADDEVQKQQIKKQLYEQELKSLAQRQAIERETLKINQEKQNIDIKRQQIQAEIATLEAQANIEQAKARGAGSSELEALNKILQLRKQQEESVQADKENLAKIQQLERQKLNVDQTAATESLQMQPILEDAKKAQEQRQKNSKGGNVVNSGGNIPLSINIPPLKPLPIEEVKVSKTDSDKKNEIIESMKVTATNVYINGTVSASSG